MEPSAPASAEAAPPRGALRVEIRLRDRRSTGTLAVVEASGGRLVFGPVPVCAAVDADFAARAGNPSLDRRRPFGDVPCGRWRLLGLAGRDLVLLPDDEDVGRHPVAVFQAIDGEAALSQAQGRGDLLLHGGPFEPGLGTLRLSEDNMGRFVAIVSGRDATASVSVVAGPLPPRPIPGRVSSPRGAFPAPPSAPAPIVVRQDDSDGFLPSYLIGWPVEPTPGAFLGAMLHDDGRRRTDLEWNDGSAARLSEIGAAVQPDGDPVRFDSGRDASGFDAGQDAPAFDSGRGGTSSFDAGRDAPAFDSGKDSSGFDSGRDSTPSYAPGGGAYDR